MPIVYLSLGSNLGDREKNLECALTTLDRTELRIRHVSHIYETTPVGVTEETVPDYLNCVAEAETSLAPIALLDYTQAAERQCGRTPTFKWGPRAIDIDIIWYEGATVASTRLTIPHIHARNRAFVLKPLLEIAPELRFGETETLSYLVSRDEIQTQSVKRLPNVLFPIRSG